MTERSLVLSLTDIVEASERVRAKHANVSFDDIAQDREARWVVERDIEINSETSRLAADVKVCHPAIPWRKVVGIRNVLQHDYDSVAAPVIWALIQHDLAPLEAACRAELAAEQAREREP
jgi:uncharacterized protein with HEPN domain